MKIVDLHCDTLYKSVINNISLSDDSMEVKKVPCIERRLQCYSIWLPDDLEGECAESLVFKSAARLKDECKKHNINLVSDFVDLSEILNSYNSNAVFTIENGIALNGKLENVKKFAELGVRMMTLTWNARNDIGGGVGSDISVGLTDFGKCVIKEMESCKIITDISHASDNLFYDVAENSTVPFAASHSNSRAMCRNKRNLTDEQFGVIKSRKGIVGLNFHNAFLNDDPDRASMYDILRHAEHFLSLGGEDVLAIGSDFDGCNLPEDISGSESLCKIYEIFLKHNYKSELIDKIFYKNAVNFFENFDNN